MKTSNTKVTVSKDPNKTSMFRKGGKTYYGSTIAEARQNALVQLEHGSNTVDKRDVRAGKDKPKELPTN